MGVTVLVFRFNRWEPDGAGWYPLRHHRKRYEDNARLQFH